MRWCLVAFGQSPSILVGPLLRPDTPYTTPDNYNVEIHKEQIGKLMSSVTVGNCSIVVHPVMLSEEHTGALKIIIGSNRGESEQSLLRMARTVVDMLYCVGGLQLMARLSSPVGVLIPEAMQAKIRRVLRSLLDRMDNDQALAVHGIGSLPLRKFAAMGVQKSMRWALQRCASWAVESRQAAAVLKAARGSLPAGGDDTSAQRGHTTASTPVHLDPSTISTGSTGHTSSGDGAVNEGANDQEGGVDGSTSAAEEDGRSTLLAGGANGDAAAAGAAEEAVGGEEVVDGADNTGAATSSRRGEDRTRASEGSHVSRVLSHQSSSSGSSTRSTPVEPAIHPSHLLLLVGSRMLTSASRPGAAPISPGAMFNLVSFAVSSLLPHLWESSAVEDAERSLRHLGVDRHNATTVKSKTIVQRYLGNLAGLVEDAPEWDDDDAAEGCQSLTAHLVDSKAHVEDAYRVVCAWAADMAALVSPTLPPAVDGDTFGAARRPPSQRNEDAGQGSGAAATDSPRPAPPASPGSAASAAPAMSEPMHRSGLFSDDQRPFAHPHRVLEVYHDDVLHTMVVYPLYDLLTGLVAVLLEPHPATFPQPPPAPPAAAAAGGGPDGSGRIGSQQQSGRSPTPGENTPPTAGGRSPPAATACSNSAPVDPKERWVTRLRVASTACVDLLRDQLANSPGAPLSQISAVDWGLSMRCFTHRHPGLVHFILVDRFDNRVVCPTIAALSPEADEAAQVGFLRDAVWGGLHHAHELLHFGFNDILYGDAGLQFSHKLWMGRDADHGDCQSINDEVLQQLLKDKPQYAQERIAAIRHGKRLHCYQLYSVHVGVVPALFCSESTTTLAIDLVELLRELREVELAAPTLPVEEPVSGRGTSGGPAIRRESFQS